MTTRGYSDGLHGNGGDGTNTEEGLAPLDMNIPEHLACDATFRGGEKFGRTERGQLIQEMQLEREERRNSRKGSPNRLARFDIGASAKVYGLRALATIVEIMENEEESAPVRLAAAREVLDRGFGRPKQVTEVGGVDGDEIRNRLIIEFVGVDRSDKLGNAGVSRAGGRMPESEINQKWGEAQRERAVASEQSVNKRWMEGVAEEVVIRSGQNSTSWQKAHAENGIGGTEVEDVEVNAEDRMRASPKPSFVKK
jgi:hypothetical protein